MVEPPYNPSSLVPVLGSVLWNPHTIPHHWGLCWVVYCEAHIQCIIIALGQACVTYHWLTPGLPCETLLPCTRTVIYFIANHICINIWTVSTILSYIEHYLYRDIYIYIYSERGGERERDRERKRQRKRDREREMKRERENLVLHLPNPSWDKHLS